LVDDGSFGDGHCRAGYSRRLLRLFGLAMTARQQSG
jgi:hypothetical protein